MLLFIIRIIMKSPRASPGLPNSDRNQKIASILTLLITISAKIERLKQKLCGFSPNEFSPECVFQALDLTSKGYLDLYDIRCFIGNDSIKDRDILLLLMRFGGTQTQPKLTYLGYLNFLKPYFNAELARDLLRRDTVSRRVGSEERVIQTQETILLLVNELLLLNCVCTAQHEELKEAMMEQYMLNVMEMAEILGVGRGAPLRAIFQFIDCNSDFDVEEGEVKFLLSYLQAHQFDLPQENVLSMLFMPTKLNTQNTTKQGSATGRTDKSAREREKLHTNYNKSYLGKKDLFTNTNKISFLEYIHPNSYPPQSSQRQPEFKRPNIGTYVSQGNESNVAQEHGRLGLPSNRRIKEPIKIKPPIVPEVNLDYSIVEGNNVFGSKATGRLAVGSQDSLYTPILQQFMHESNLKHNMGSYHQSHQDSEHRTLFEESSVNDSEPFDRMDSKRDDPFKKHPSRYAPLPLPKVLQNRQLMESSAKLQSSSGILNQFMKS